MRILVLCMICVFAASLLIVNSVTAQRAGINAEEFNEKVVSQIEEANTNEPSSDNVNIEWTGDGSSE